ncbi:hypothetical protein GTGU_03587 [Trabulsiella guamensis ATCC 49490]|uniref:Uncharacterized protein n=1 Tax=Trabulsiella guamensis ATCC 49490 TaxID=1005994 RepID=A0A084ZUC5_9ENTR|nr:hypothetical protein GTGU_03587 [Trabulsiella guamensis ATCC 49490]
MLKFINDNKQRIKYFLTLDWLTWRIVILMIAVSAILKLTL